MNAIDILRVVMVMFIVFGLFALEWPRRNRYRRRPWWRESTHPSFFGGCQRAVDK
jgi:hypothetical protein